MVKVFVIIVHAFLVLITPDQPEINYKHKRIYKEMERVWEIKDPLLTELLIPDDLARNNFILGKYFEVSDKDEFSGMAYLYVGRVNSCRAGGCSIPDEPGFSSEMEYFDYLICFDSSKTVQSVNIFNYMATHGHEVSAKGWLKQFRGYNGQDTLEVTKNVDAIAGATISVYGITEDVMEKTALLKKLK